MPSRKESRAKRRKQLFDSAKRRRPTDSSLRRPFLGDGPPGGNSIDNPHPMWDFFARAALRLDGHDIMTKAMRTAFEEFKLDPVDPFSWRELLAMFAYVEFGKLSPGTAGAPKKWSEERLRKLHAAANIVRGRKPGISDTRIARELARHPEYRVRGIDANSGSEGLRKAIRLARRTVSPRD